MMCAVLLAKHALHNASEHMKLKKKGDYIAVVRSIFSHLPEGLTPQVTLL